MMTYDYFDVSNVAFIKSGKKDWTFVDEWQDVKDIIYCNELFYALDKWSVLYSCNVSNDNDVKARRITSERDEKCADRSSVDVSNLVESPEGDLLRVVQERILEKFAVYKLVWFSKNPRWERLSVWAMLPCLWERVSHFLLQHLIFRHLILLEMLGDASRILSTSAKKRYGSFQ